MLYVATVQKAKGSHKIHTPVFQSKKHETRRHRSSKLTESQKIALKWRELYGLQPIQGKPRPDAIRDLQGMMKTEMHIEENPVDAIREIRENIY